MPDLAWSLDGRPFRAAEDWQATMTANGGYRDASVSCPAVDLPTSASQESELSLHEGSEERWAGTLITRPYITDGVAQLQAEGPIAILERQAGRRFYQTQGVGLFTDAGSDPHGYAHHNAIDSESLPAALKFHTQKGEDFASGVKDGGQVLWIEGALITKLSYRWHVDPTSVNFDIGTYSGTGPSGSLSSIDTQGLGTATGTKTITLTTPRDIIKISYQTDGTTITNAVRRRLIVSALKVYGRASGDSLAASEVMTDTFAEAGFDTSGVQSSGFNVLPLDWLDDWVALVDYLADLVDWHYSILGKSERGLWRAQAGPWEREWTVYRGRNAETNLPPLPLFNRVIVPYESISGVHRQAEGVPAVDPLPGHDRPLYADALSDPQPDSTLALEVAQVLAARHATERVRGTVRVVELRDSFGSERSPYALRAGDLLNIADHQPFIPPQRVQSVTYRANKDVSAEIEEEIDITALLSTEVSIRGKHKRRKKKHRGKGRGHNR